jgi:tripartite-type tricarboxylate transporter receptor subunit TctC
VAFSAVPPAAPQIQQGLLRGLAVTAATRSKALPDVPTMAEAGIPGQEAYTLTGILAPAGTPKALIELLHREIVALVALPDVETRLDELGFEVVASSPQEFAQRIKTEMEKWSQVIRDAKIKAQDAK